MTSVAEFSPFLAVTTATIANGQTTSSAIDLSGTTLVGIQLPASFTGTSLTFQAATTAGGTYQTVIDGSGTTISRAISQGRYLTLNPIDFAGIQFLKVVSSASEGGQRNLELISRPV